MQIDRTDTGATITLGKNQALMRAAFLLAVTCAVEPGSAAFKAAREEAKHPARKLALELDDDSLYRVGRFMASYWEPETGMALLDARREPVPA